MPVELEDEVRRLKAESLAVRTILAHLLARLSASANLEVAAAIRSGLEDAERALRERSGTQGLTPRDLATALTAVETVKGETRRTAKPSDVVKEDPAAFHAESNDQWPEDDY
jgi:hypothetical protein